MMYVLGPKEKGPLNRLAARAVGGQIQRLKAGRRSGGASVSVLETTDLGLGHDPPLARWLNLGWPRSVAFEGLVGPQVVVMLKVLT